MAAICDMAKGRLADCRYFLGIVHGGIKTGFIRKKEASSCVQMVFTVCCLLLTADDDDDDGLMLNVLRCHLTY